VHGKVEIGWLAWGSFPLGGYGCQVIAFWFRAPITWLSFLSNVSLSIRLLLEELLVLLVALLLLPLLNIIFFLPLIWTLNNEVPTLSTIVTHSLWSCSLLLVYLERFSFAHEFVKLLDLESHFFLVIFFFLIFILFFFSFLTWALNHYLLLLVLLACLESYIILLGWYYVLWEMLHVSCFFKEHPMVDYFCKHII
jgi:hypothetical protein